MQYLCFGIKLFILDLTFVNIYSPIPSGELVQWNELKWKNQSENSENIVMHYSTQWSGIGIYILPL